MARYSKVRRQAIVQEFAGRHNGQYDPSLFLAEVEEKGPEHPAHGWFEWDSEKAVREYHLWQARVFASGLRVAFTVESIGRTGTISVRESEMPMVLSSMDGRRTGGGYFLVDTDNPEHMAEHCRQAATSLRGWLDRYKSALDYSGANASMIEKALRSLDSASTNETAEEAA